MPTYSTVALAGSSLVFNNTFSANCSAQFISCIIAAEHDLQSHWTNADTINVSFDAVAAGTTGFLASNNFSILEYHYAALAAALRAHANSTDAQTSVATLPSVDPSNGTNWELPVAYARMLGLTSASPATDDSVTLNTSYGWAYGQDVIATVEHELTEGAMGRIGSLGTDGDWSTMDLFRYSAPGVRDYTDGRDGKATHFSIGDSNLSTLTYNNNYSGTHLVNNNDTADFTQLDVFGTGQPGQGLTLSNTDLQVMNVLGWTPAHADSFIHSGTWTTADAGTDGWYVGDFNGDGRADVFRYILNQSGADVSLSTGAAFQEQGSWTGAGYGSDGVWHLGDFNGDGRTDIFRYLPGVSGADVFVSNGTSFQHVGGWTGAGEGSDGKWYVGDFNGDGRADIFRYEAGQSGADVFLSTGNSFQHQGSWLSAMPSADGWSVGDFNGDGRDDIFTMSSGVGIQVYLSTGSGFALSGTWTPAGGGFDGWNLGDFNGDGRTDIARNISGSGLQVFLSTGSSFQYDGVWTSATPGSDKWNVGDFNGDGSADIFRFVTEHSGADVFISSVSTSGSSGQTALAQTAQGATISQTQGDSASPLIDWHVKTSTIDSDAQSLADHPAITHMTDFLI